MYPCVEVAVALVFVACFKFSADFLESSLFALLNYLFIIAIVIDLREKLILNTVNSAIGITLFFLNIIDLKEIHSVLTTPLIVVCISLGLKSFFEKIKNVSALGEGDIKLMIALSFGLEISELPLWFSFAGGLGILTGLLWKKLKQEEQFPFAPALIIAFLITYLIHKFKDV